MDGWVWVEVRPVEETETQSVTVTYWDTVNNKQVGETFTIEVAADATNLNTSTLTNIPEGYELVWTGDLAIENGAVRVEIRPVTAPPVEKTFTVTFDSNGGSAVASQTVKEGEKAAKPANPTRDGYTFEGWFADEALKTAYDFNTPVTSDITLYADWDRRSSGGGGGGGSAPGLSGSAVWGVGLRDGPHLSYALNLPSGRQAGICTHEAVGLFH